MKHAVIETYCDNWLNTGDWRIDREFEAPMLDDYASLAEREAWLSSVPRARSHPRSTAPRAVVRLAEDGSIAQVVAG
jgi:hypothetical protein